MPKKSNKKVDSKSESIDKGNDGDSDVQSVSGKSNLLKNSAKIENQNVEETQPDPASKSPDINSETMVTKSEDKDSKSESTDKDNDNSDARSIPEKSSPTEEKASSGGSVTLAIGGWFSSIVQTAKQTVNESTMQSIKRDLTQLKDVVQHDTSSIVSSTASFVKNTFNEIGNSVSEIGSLGTNVDDDVEQQIKDEEELQKNIDEQLLVDKKEKGKNKNQNEDDNGLQSPGSDSSEKTASSASNSTKNQSTSLPFDFTTINSWKNKFTDTAKTTMSLVKDTLVDSIFANFSIDELDDEPYVILNGEMIMIENWKQLLHNLQIDPNTYCREPSGLLEDFDNWLVKFNLINYQKQTEHLIETVPEIKKYHDELVPKTLSENDFWHRYFYKVHMLKEEQANLIRKQNKLKSQDNSNDNNKTMSHSRSSSNKSDPNIISQSSTEDWEKVSQESNLDYPTTKDDNQQQQKDRADSKCSSDDDIEKVDM